MAEGDIEHGHVDTNDTVKGLLENYEEVQYSSSQHRGSIFMVPKVYRDLSKPSFTPRVVSIGPLHHQDEHLKGFEVHKVTYMHTLLREVLSPRLLSTPEQILKECVAKVSGSLHKIKACYFGMQRYPDSELVKMMVTDACFILAFLHNPYIHNYSSLGPIDLLRDHIYLDMVLIENQIPFFVLEGIFNCTFLKHHPSGRLAEYISPILGRCSMFERDILKVKSSISSTYDHILGFLHKFYQNPDSRYSSTVPERKKAHSAVELHRSGVRFSNKKVDATWLMAMEFVPPKFLCFPLPWGKPTLKMPVLIIGDSTDVILRNLVLYEQSHNYVEACFTSYLFALDMLIDTPEDVAKLVESKVLVNYRGSNEEVANTINTICEEVSISDFYYAYEWEQMDEYYNGYWPNLLAELRRRYFSNPWSIIALIAGVVLFVLTVVQTIYAVKDSKAA